MPRHRSLNLKKFLNSIPEYLIKEYFEQKAGDGDSFEPEAFDNDTVSSYLNDLPDEELQRSILEDFTHINDICEKTMNYLVEAINRYDIPTTGEEQKLALAILIFLRYPDAFEYAYDYYCLYNSTSKMSQHNITADDVKITSEKVKRFKERIQAYYHERAKGRECVVRHYDEMDQTVIVVIHGSYKRSMMVWDEQVPRTLFFRPANEDILQFNKQRSVLSIKAPYKKDKENYIKVFTETILDDEDQTERPDRDTTYTLEPLQNGTFSFAGNERIVSVTLLEVKLAMRGVTKPDIVIKSSDVLRTLSDDVSGLSLSAGEMVHAKFRFVLQVNGKRRRVTFEITPPNVTDLVKKRYADIIAAYLEENGVKLV